MNVPTVAETKSEIMEAVLVKGDLGKLTPDERNRYYIETCQSLGLNPLTKPFDYLVLNGRTVMYAKRDAADQLRKINGVNIEIIDKTIDNGMFAVTVRATDKTGRQDEDMGVVTLPPGAGDIRANAMLKAITKAKRRVTLSICGLGFLDETEVEDIPADAKRAPRKHQPIRTITQTDKPAQVSSDPTPTTAGSSPTPSPMAQDEPAALSDIEQQLDEGLAQAALAGMDSLQEEWATLHPKYKTRLKARLDKVHKLTAHAADKSHGAA